MAIATSPIRAVLAGSACLAVLAAPAFAAPGAKSGCGHPGMLTISGHGESRVAPDQVMISLGVTTQADTAAQAMQDNSTRQQAVLDTLTGAGVGEADIQTSGLTLNPMMQYPEDGTAPSIDGYMAQNLLTVRVTEIERIGTVLDSIVEAGANEMQGIRFIREDSQTTEDEALSQAVADATHRAQVMAEAAGVELGPIMRMGEPDQNVIAPDPAVMRAMDASGQAESIPVEGGEVAFTSDVEVTFALAGGGACAMPGGEDGATETGGGQSDTPPRPRPLRDAAPAPEAEPASGDDAARTEAETASPASDTDAMGSDNSATPDAGPETNEADTNEAGNNTPDAQASEAPAPTQ